MARKNSATPSAEPKPKKQGVLISQQKELKPAALEPEQKQKVSADMIAIIEQPGGPAQPPEDFITKYEVARRLGRSPRTIHRLKQNGLIPYYKVGKFVYFRWSEVQSAIATICRRLD